MGLEAAWDKGRLMRWQVVLCGLLYMLAVGVSGADDFDTSRYRPDSLGDLTRAYPAQRGLSLVRDVPIRSTVVYSGEFRDLPQDARSLIRAWSESMSVPGITDAFKREVKVRQTGIDYWVPVQEAVAPIMAAELRAGEEIQLFAIYIGQVEGRHLFLINAFDHKDARHPPR